VAFTIPSGRQFVLESGNQRVTVTEVGAGLRTFTVSGEAVLDGYGEREMCDVCRGALLLPWPNRIEDGAYEFDGRRHQLALTEPSRQNAIHGLTRWLTWTVVHLDRERVELGLTLHPQEGYPFALGLAVEYRLAVDGLTVRTTGTNMGDGPLPYGTGHHPYLTVGGSIDEARLRLPALMRLEANQRLIPTGRALPVRDTEYDFLELRTIGSLQMDTAFAGLVADADARIRSVLQSRDGRRRLTLWMEAPYSHLMVFTGDAIPDPRRRRQSIAIEPMTCAPNAYRSGDGLRRLEPGESLSATWGIEVRL
jgi:aldose 1-epimerase